MLINTFKRIRFRFKCQRKLFKRPVFLKWFDLKRLDTFFCFMPIKRYELIDISYHISIELLIIVQDTSELYLLSSKAVNFRKGS